MKHLTLAALAVVSLCTPCFAGEPAASDTSARAISHPSDFDDWLNGKYLTGDWGGLRDRLNKQGIEPFLYYTNNIAGNPVGGYKEGGLTYTDDFFFGLNLYLDKLVGWKGAKFVISGINRDGHSLTNQNVGSVYNSQQVYGGQTIFLYNVTLEQTLLDDKLSIKVGRFGACDDFNNSPIYNLYMNNGIDGDIRNVLFDTQFSAYPFATWAARANYFITKDLTAKFGVFQTTNNVFDRNEHGVDWSIGRHDGVFLISQLNWAPELFKKPISGAATAAATTEGSAPVVAGNSHAAAPTEEGLPGHYIFGGSYSPWEGYSQFRRPGLTENSYGFYAHADQMVYREKPGQNSAEGLTLWTAGAYYPQQNIAIVPFQINAGLIYEGLFPTRDQDKLLFGVIYGKFSRDYAHNFTDVGRGNPDYELVLEAAYRIQLTKFAYIQPDLQGIIHPGGTGRIPDALVAGAQMGLVF